LSIKKKKRKERKKQTSKGLGMIALN